MTIQRFRRAFALALCAIVPAAPAIAGRDHDAGVIARFEGKEIDLSEGWGEARACVIAPNGARCYRTETELDSAEGPMPEPGGPVPFAECSSKLRLYDGISYGGAVLELQTRLVYHNLASSGFNNLTSSYKVGACSSRLYDTTTGGTQYPGNTNAGVSAASMAAGWDNRVGSVYIN